MRRKDLEQRYRSSLRLLPTWYRERWAEEMVTTFIDSSCSTGDPDEQAYRAEFGRPGLAERLSVLGLAARLRLGGAEAPPRSQLWGEAVRRYALVGLLVFSVSAVVELALMLRNNGWLPGTGSAATRVMGEPAAWSIAEVARTSTSLLWLAAFVALLLGKRRAAGIVAASALVWPAFQVLGLGLPFGPWSAMRWWPFTLFTAANLLVSVSVVAAMTAFHREAPPLRPRGWLIAFTVALAAMVPLHLWHVLALPLFLVDWLGLHATILVVAVAWHLFVPGLRGRQREPAWSLALTLIAIASLVLRLASLAMYLGGGSMDDAMLSSSLAHTALIALVIVTMTPFAIRELRRRPAAPESLPAR